MDEEEKGHIFWEFGAYKRFGADLPSINHFGEPLAFCNARQNSPAGLPHSILPLAAAYTSRVMANSGTDTNDLRAALPAVADSSGRSPSHTAWTAFVQGTTKLGPAVDTSALVPHIESSEKKHMVQGTGRLEAATVTSDLEGPEIQGDKSPTMRTTPAGGSQSRPMKPQAGDRSRFRPWGYI